MGKKIPSGNSGGDSGGCLSMVALAVGFMLLLTAAPIALIIDAYVR